MDKKVLCTIVKLLAVLLLAALLCACSQNEETPDFSDIDFSSVDFTASPYKHITNGGITETDTMPYNIDAITGATVTVEGPAVTASIPLSMREIENRNDGLRRGVYTDSGGSFIYEGIDLYYLLTDMSDGDNGIILTDSVYSVELKDSNRSTVANFSLDEIKAAKEGGKPILLAYGIGAIDGSASAPFVFDAANPDERSAGYIEKLDNADGCLKLVYDADAAGADPDEVTFSNIAYIYVREKGEPGYKHAASDTEAYNSSRYSDYIITFRGSALGCEIGMTVGQLEELAAYSGGTLIQGGIGYSASYSLANNAYWYVNEYEGLDLYKLLLYLGMDGAEEMGLAAARTTLVSFIADDGVPAHESFSIDTLSYPDAFGFYNKNASDQGDGGYVPTNADLVDTGYPVLLAYGVNRYPYTITKTDAGYLSGLQNSGGPMRVVFGKTQYNHANGSNQVQYLREVIAGEDVLYNTHAYTDVTAHQALADYEISVTVNSENGQALTDKSVTVREIEDVIYGDGVSGQTRKASQVKDTYETETGGRYVCGIYEGVSLEYFLMNVLGLPGTNGAVTFTGDGGDITVNLDSLTRSGFNTALGRDKLIPIIAFAKNGSPMVQSAGDAGYVKEILLKPFLDTDPPSYAVDNSGGPIAVIIPSSDPDNCNAISVMNLTAITVNLVPDAYAHISEPYNAYASHGVRLYGEGLEREAELAVSEIESRQTKAKTLDYSMLDSEGIITERRYRGVAVYDLFMEIGIKSNAGDVTVYSSDGSSVTFPLSALKKQSYINYVSPEKEHTYAMLAFGAGIIGADTMAGFPLTASDRDSGYNESAQNSGGPLKLIIPQENADSANAEMCIQDVVAIEVTANEIETWGHSMSDIYADFLDYEFTLTVKNDDSEWSRVFTVGELEELADITVRDLYTVLDIGECEGIDIWKLILRYASDVPGIDEPVSITAYASDGYKNDLLSVFYREGFELGVADEDGNRKRLIIAYAIGGLPLVDDQSHEGYTGIAGNSAGPLRIIAESNQGASVKYLTKIVVTVPGSGAIDGVIDNQGGES